MVCSNRLDDMRTSRMGSRAAGWVGGGLCPQAWEVFAGSDPFTKDPEVQFFEVAAKPPKARRGWGRRR